MASRNKERNGLSFFSTRDGESPHDEKEKEKEKE